MPVGPTRTKVQKHKVAGTEMKKFAKGELHSGSPSGPVVTNPAQAKAIAMSESKQSKPKKEKGYDRSGHFSGNPGFNREGKPPYGRYDGGHQAKQPRGKSTGEKDGPKGHVGTSFEQEAKEQGGARAMSPAMGSGHEHHSTPVANVGTEKRGTHLVGQDSEGHAKQPHGKILGAGRTDIAEHHMGHGMGPATHFRMPPAHGAHGFTGTHKSGLHRVSGHKSAHQIGKR